MELVLTEEQTLLQQTAREFVTNHSSLRRIRALRDSQDLAGFSRDLWHEMAKLGWWGITFSEEYGGAGLGFADLMVVLEELGRGLMPEPMLSTVALGGTAIAMGASPARRQTLLPAIINGELLVALAAYEARSRYNPRFIETRAASSSGGWKLSGEKLHVLDGYGADRSIVSARTGGGAGVYAGSSLFPDDAPGPGL